MTITAGLPERLVEFVGALRLKGMPAGTSETVDAAAIVDVLGLTNREQLREGLAAALVRRGGQRDVFDPTFDIYFPAGVGSREATRGQDDEVTAESLREALLAAMAANDDQAIGRIAGMAVDALGQVPEGGSSATGYSAYQTLDRIQPQTLIAEALARMGDGDGFANRVARDELRRRVGDFRNRVATEARRRTAELRGRDRVTKHAVRPSSGQVNFLTADQKQLAELRRTIQPLSRKLATRLAARRRRNNRGTIDIRRTVRRSLTTGGVPMRPAYAKRHPGRPELVLLCDVSGSVAGFANFTMLLVQALHTQFSRVRVFAFINAMDEVTDILSDHNRHGTNLTQRIANEAAITKWHTSSDYGEAFGDFAQKYLDALNPRTSVLILGDARNNNQDPNMGALHEIMGRAKHAYWLNPEYSSRWSTGDSDALDYAEIIDMVECCNIDQLSKFITKLLPA